MEKIEMPNPDYFEKEILEKNIAWFDLEITGISTEKDRICQICIIITDRNLNVIAGPFTSLINPEMEISEGASEVHCITNEMVKDAPTFIQVAHNIFNLLKDCDFGYYNGTKFDLPILINEFERAGINLSIKGKKLFDAYLVFTKKEPRNLTAALKFYSGKTMVDAHDAEADVLATIEVARGQISMYDDIEDVDDLYSITEPENTCDLAGKIVMKKGVPIFNFGQHFGKPISEQTGFLNWMLDKDFPKETKDWITNYLATQKE